VLDTLTEQEVRVSLDLFGLAPGEYTLEPDVDVPDRGLELRSIQPSTIDVIITEPLTPTGDFSDIESMNLGTLHFPVTNHGGDTAVPHPILSASFVWLPKPNLF
jgi:hypothetical protein